MKRQQITINTGFWIVALIVLSISSLFIGVHTWSFHDFLAGEPQAVLIFRVSRLPRLLSVLCVGAGLSVSGLLMQTLYHNRFISPTTMGTMDFSKLGILLSMLIFGPNQSLFKLIFAFAISLSGTFLLLRLITYLKVKNEILVPLIGLVFGQVVSAFTSYIAYQFDLIQSVNAWLQGSFTLITNQNNVLLYLIIPALGLIFFFKSLFNIVGLGQNMAINLGVNYQQVLLLGLACVSLISSVTLVSIGNIPFIGLIIGNLVTLFVGDNLKQAIPLAALIGAIFLILCDIVSRLLIFPYEVPISLVISVIGSVVFLWILYRGSQQ